MTYQTAAQLRAAFGDVLTDTSKFPDATLEGHLAAFDAIAVDYRGISFSARTEREVRIPRESTTELRLRWPKVREITSVTVTNPTVGGTATTIAATEYAVDGHSGILHYPAGFPAGATVTVVYTHGLGYRVLTDAVTTDTDATLTSAAGAFTDTDLDLPISGTGIPAGATIATRNSATSIELSAAATASGTDVSVTIADPILVQAAREYVRACALAARSGVPRDVINQSVDGITQRFSTPDKRRGRPTGYLEVDRLLNSLPDYRAPF